MGGAAGSLSAAISGADDKVTVLDDKVDAEDHAAYLWLKAHVLQGVSALPGRGRDGNAV